jgi:tetratricopeptide (TPR) repeat protein
MQKAETSYRQALDQDLQSFEGGFNLGAALFKQQKFDEAAQQFELLSNKSSDKMELADVYYNLGNSRFAGGKLQEAIEAYKQSLRNNPADTAAKYNLAVAQKLLKENPPQQSKDQQQQDQQQDQQQQDQQQQQKQQEQEQEQEQQQQQEQQSSGDQEKEEAEEKEAAPAEPKDQISKEDAERMLQMLMQEEKKVLDKLQQEKAKQRPKKLDKDW